MSLDRTIAELSTIARFDEDSIPEDGVWVWPMLPPGTYEGYQDPAIVADISAGQRIGKAALAPHFADETTPASVVIEVTKRIPSALHTALESYPRDAIGVDMRGNPTAALITAAESIGGKVLKATISTPGVPNTTVIPIDSIFPYKGMRAGFHNDQQDRKPLSRRTEGRRRFIPNAGPGSRIAGVCLPDIVTVARALGYPEDEAPDYHLFREYQRRYPEGTFCIGLPVMPGQGSVVNTDLYVHDGMSIGATQESLTVQILGSWSRGELARLS
jgi:hypothetical protein